MLSFQLACYAAACMNVVVTTPDGTANTLFGVVVVLLAR